jgi:hypothetical protein
MSPASKPGPYGIDRATGPASPAGSAPTAAGRRGEPAFDVQEDRGIHVVTLLRGQILDANEIQTLGVELTNYFAKKPRAKVVLDITPCSIFRPALWACWSCSRTRSKAAAAHCVRRRAR